MLATDAHRHLRAGETTEAHTHVDEPAHAVTVKVVEGILRQNALLGIFDQELRLGVIAADAKGRLREVIRAKAEELRFSCHLVGGERRTGIDIMGGIASLLTTALLEAGESVVHVTGIAVNRARQGTRGGETKSDPRDARAIADLVRSRRKRRRSSSRA